MSITFKQQKKLVTYVNIWCVFILTCSYFLSMPSHAKKMYKFQDEQGHWYYTDKKPVDERQKELNVEVRQLKVEAKQRVWLDKIGDARTPQFLVRNNFFGPIEVKVIFDKQDNVRAKPNLPKTFVISPGVSEPLLQLEPISEYQSWSSSLRYYYALGSPFAEHQPQAVYYPPFSAHKKFQITQSFKGIFSHTDEQNKYAVDFSMPEGSEIHAARGGIVMSLDNDFFKGGVDKQAYKARANSIRILHDDGSMAVYAHLQVERAQVYEGMPVKAGDLIAYSGNTGFSSGPHLHFSIQVNKGMALEAVPFNFTNDQGEIGEPLEGQWLAGVSIPTQTAKADFY